MAKIEENIITNATPLNLKQKGLAVLGTILTNQAMVFADKIIPTLEKTLLGFKEGCPTNKELARIVNTRNNIVGQSDSISKTISKIISTIAKASIGISTLIGLIRVLKITKKGIAIAAKVIPAGLPGAIPAAISDIDDLITNKTFDIEGNTKIAPIRSAIDGIAVPLALISFYIAKFISITSILDKNIQECSTNPLTLPPVSEELVEISQIQDQAEESPNLSTYQGFILEIEKVPYSPTVNRIRAVGKNQDGIILIQTELSFTPVDQIMINELKFIIDRDNLKAY